MLRSAPCAGEWVAEEPMEASPPTSPLLINTKQRLPTSPILNNSSSSNSSSSKQTSNSSSKQGSKQQTGKQAQGSLLSASEPRTSSKVFISFQSKKSLISAFSKGFTRWR